MFRHPYIRQFVATILSGIIFFSATPAFALNPQIVTQRPEFVSAIDHPSLGNSLGILGADEKSSLVRKPSPNFFKLILVGGLAFVTGCISQKTIDDIRKQDAMPNSYITNPSSITFNQLTVNLNEIAEINSGTSSGARPISEYIAVRNYGIIGAQYRQTVAEQQANFIAGGEITPQFAIESPINGDFGVYGRIVFRLPTSLGGGVIYFPIGVTSIDEDLKAAVSFLASTQNIIVGAGNYFSEMNDIAVRNTVYVYKKAIIDVTTKVQSLYREIWYLERSTRITREQLEVLNQELSFANEQLAIEPRNPQYKEYVRIVREQISQKNEELTINQTEYEQKIEDLHIVLNINPAIRIVFSGFESIDPLRPELFTTNCTDMDILLRRVAEIDKRVGLAQDRYTALGHLIWLEDRKVLIPDAVLNIFGSYGIDPKDDRFLDDRSDYVRFFKRGTDQLSILLKGPELVSFITRIHNGNAPVLDRLRQQKLEIDEVKAAVLAEVRASWRNLRLKKAALIRGYQKLSSAKEKLEQIRAERQAGDPNMADDFSKRREIFELEKALAKKWLEYTAAMKKFQGYFPDDENLRRNILNPASRERILREEGAEQYEALRDFANSGISWRFASVSSGELIQSEGRSLGKTDYEAMLKGKRALRILTNLFPAKKVHEPIRLFLEEKELPRNPDFLDDLSGRVHSLEIFVRENNVDAAKKKITGYFGLEQLPPNIHIHIYEGNSYYSALNRILADGGSEGVNVVLGEDRRLFDKLTRIQKFIKLAHGVKYSREFALALAERLGSVKGDVTQVAGLRGIVFRFDFQSGVFYLLPVQILVENLFSQGLTDRAMRASA